MPLRIVLSLLLCVGALQAQGAGDVTLDGRKLWTVRVGRPGLTPEERAQDIVSNLIHVAEDSRMSLSDVRDVRSDDETILLISRVYVFTVTDEDAATEGLSRDDLYAAHKQSAIDAIAQYRTARSYSSIVKRVIQGILAILLAVGIVAFLRFIHSRFTQRFERLLEYVPAQGQMGVVYRLFRGPLLITLRLLVRGAFFTAAVIVCFAAFSYVLGLIPFTAGIADAVLQISLSSLRDVGAAIAAYVPNLMVLILVALLTYVLIKIAKVFEHALETGTIQIHGFHAEWAKPTYDLLKVLLIMFALVVAFPYLPGGDSPALRGASIFIGVLVSLGSGSAMGNIIAGVILTYMRPFAIGDRVGIGDVEGDVMERSLLVTRILTIKNVEVILPNSSILSGHIINYSVNSRTRGVILHTTVTIGYDAPWQKVHELLIAAALKTPHVLADPAPFVLQTSLNDSHISYEINAYTNDVNRKALVYSELHKNIQEQFNSSGMEIMSPMFLSVRDGNTVTIPEAQRPAGYVAPEFRVRTSSPDPETPSAKASGTGV